MSREQAAALIAFVNRAIAIGVQTTLPEAQTMTAALIAVEGVAQGRMTCTFAQIPAEPKPEN